MPAFEQSIAQLASIDMQQTDLQRAVAAGQLWMDGHVAENAAKCCEKAVNDIDELLRHTDQLTKTSKFGDNADGNRAAKRYVDAGQDYIATMQHAQRVFTNMAATFRAAGRTVKEADEAGQQSFGGLPG